MIAPPVEVNHAVGVGDIGARDELAALFSTARRLHFLGPGDVAGHLEHSVAFARLVPQVPDQAVDLGSGAGVPGLVLACVWPESRWLLVESNQRRAEFLDHSLDRLGLAPRVVVACERAEVIGRQAAYRGAADLVVARGFGPPAVAAECAAPLLRVGGTLVVAEPPGGRPERWPPSVLSALGMVPATALASPVALQSLRQAAPCSGRFPRRVGVPAKRPLWTEASST